MTRVDTDNLSMNFWEKWTLTVPEACVYFHIGEKKMKEIIDDYSDADFILMSGKRTMIKRKRFEKFIDQQIAI